MTVRRDFDALKTGNNGNSCVQNLYLHLDVNRHKHKMLVFVQFNTTQVYLINFNYLRMYATFFGPYFGNLQVC
jgi:hypothetical protein